MTLIVTFTLTSIVSHNQLGTVDATYSSMIREVNSYILSQADRIRYRVADIAPGTECDLWSTKGGELVIWQGESDNTVFGDARVNHAFRALHDTLHLETGIGFAPLEEIELGRIQASLMPSAYLADLVYCEVAEQARYYLETGQFVTDQVAFATERGLI